MAAYCSFESLFFFPPSLVRKQCVNCSSSSLFLVGHIVCNWERRPGAPHEERERSRERESFLLLYCICTCLQEHISARGGKEALHSYSIFFSCSQEIPRLIAAMQQGRRPSVRRWQKAATQKQPCGRYNLVTFFPCASPSPLLSIEKCQ